MANPRLIGLGIAIAALVGVVAAGNPKARAMAVGAVNLVGVSLTPNNSSVDTGPSYLTWNQPYYYGTPASAVMPSTAQQVAGASATPIPQFSNMGCGCS